MTSIAACSIDTITESPKVVTAFVAKQKILAVSVIVTIVTEGVEI